MGNSASALPYSIGKVVSSDGYGWELHEGNQKSDGAVVSVFVAKKPALVKPSGPTTQNKPLLQPAIHHFTYCKKLRHPHILQVLATLDTDHPNDATSSGGGDPSAAHAGAGGGTNASKAASETGDFIIVTEPCMPFETWLQSNPDPEGLAWGLEALVRALSFLHNSANLSHGNLSPSSFVVTPAGDVKLWNFSLVTSSEISPHFREWESVLTPSQYRSPERCEQRWDAISTAGVHVMDSYSLGVLVPHIFGGITPGPLVKAVQRLQTPNLRMRPRLQPLLKCPVFDTPYQKLQLQLEEFTVQPVESKISFWNNLTPNLQAGLIPPFLAVHKLLPMIKSSIATICNSDIMKSQDLYRREVAAMVSPMFFIVERYIGGTENISKELTATVAILFQVNDRGVRGSLLQKAPFLAQHLDKSALNSSVFEPMCTGFNDSAPALREMTLKAAAVLVPHLTAPNLEKLSRYLVRLQSDSESSIRTNTVIFFCKLAPYLSDMTRDKLLLPAFIRALKDQFTPCRIAALKSTFKAKEFFDPQSIATKVLPAVTPHLLDNACEVRKEAYHIVEDFLFVLRQEGERMAVIEEEQRIQQQRLQQQQQAQQQQQHGLSVGSNHSSQRGVPAPAVPVAAPAPTSGGYLSGLSSWMVSSAKAASPVAANPAPKVQIPAPASAPPFAQGPPLTAVGPPENHNDVSDGWGDEDDTWNDDDDNIGKSPPAKAAAPAPRPTAVAPIEEDEEEDEDPFANIGIKAKPVRPGVSLVIGGRPAGVGAAKGKLAIPLGSKKPLVAKVPVAPKPAVTKISVDEDVSDGWDDF